MAELHYQGYLNLSKNKVWPTKMKNKIAENNSKVGIIGLGSVGGALKHTLEFFYKVAGYDINGNYDWNDILNSDILFICVQTDGGNDGRLDCSHVTEVLSRLSEDGYVGIAVIRSTLRVGYMEFATKAFQDLHLVYSPEFIRERSLLQWEVCPDRIVMSGSKEDVDRALKYFGWAEEAEVLVMDYRSAEIGKLAHNAYIATKVSFTNEMEMICGKLGGDAESVMNIVTADRRVRSKEHLRPFLGPYDGKCVPKDTLELITAAENPILLSAVYKVNEMVKNDEAMTAAESNTPKYNSICNN